MPRNQDFGLTKSAKVRPRKDPDKEKA